MSTLNPYISAQEGESIRDEFFKAFLTAKQIGNVRTITFSRSTDGVLANVVVEGVLISLADRESQVVVSGRTQAIVTQAQLAREEPFDVKGGDLFVLDGRQCKVIVVYPTMNRVIRADVQFMNPYG